MTNSSTVFITGVDEQKAEICNVAPLLLPQEKELEPACRQAGMRHLRSLLPSISRFVCTTMRK